MGIVSHVFTEGAAVRAVAGQPHYRRRVMSVKKKPQDDSWIFRPGIDRLEDVWDGSASDPPEDEEPSIWSELAAVSPSDPLYRVKIGKIYEKNFLWVEEFLAHLPVVRAQDANRAMSDPSWLDEDSYGRRVVSLS
jgi:hypothetical protein